MNSTYPTKKEILEHKVDIPPVVVEHLKMWKIKHYNKRWGKLDNREKNESLLQLSRMIQYLYKADLKPYTDVVFTPVPAFYSPLLDVINLQEHRPSIITTLHETAHALFGRSELVACAFSVHLFKKAFPKAYAKCVWNGHLLTYAPTDQNTD